MVLISVSTYKYAIFISLIKFSLETISEIVKPHAIREARSPQSHGRRKQNAMNNADPNLSTLKPQPSTYYYDDSYDYSDEER